MSVPSDVSRAATAGEPLPPLAPAQGGLAPEEELSRASELLRRAQRPVLLLGVAAGQSAATAAIRRLLHQAALPVACTFEGNGVVPRDLLDRFQIVGKKDLYPNQLSGGQQQLVAVARALVANPKLILADEPTGNLHSSQGKEIMELFKRLNGEGTTIIQVTHSEANAAYSDRIVKLFDGWIVKD